MPMTRTVLKVVMQREIIIECVIGIYIKNFNGANLKKLKS